MRTFARAALLGALLPSLMAAAKPLPTYSLDKIVLGSNVGDLLRVRGVPQTTGSGVYRWTNSAGGTLSVFSNTSGRIVMIDVLAGPKEVRDLELPAQPPQVSVELGNTGHLNYLQPVDARLDDSCGNDLFGSPCFAWTLPGAVELVTNFGKENGTMDGFLSEVILSDRLTLLQRSIVLPVAPR